jgi:ribonucleoside-triphosphate reductase (thioredoxin)
MRKHYSGPIPWGEVGYVTFKRTYARQLGKGTEEFPDTVNRVVNAANKQLKCNFNEEEKARIAEIMLTLKGTVAGRFLWQLGTETVDRLGLPSLQNCAFVVVDEPIRPFTWAFEMLMLGSGVGFNIQKHNVAKLPAVKSKSVTVTRFDNAGADFIVPDSREGWTELLHKVLEASFVTGKSFTYSTQLIRPKGTPIKGFGGTASGPEPLAKGVSQINEISALKEREEVTPYRLS